MTVSFLEKGQGTPLVLLHGIGSAARSFDRVIAAFAPRFRVVAWDAPGYGDVDRPADGAPDGRRLCRRAGGVSRRDGHSDLSSAWPLARLPDGGTLRGDPTRARPLAHAVQHRRRSGQPAGRGAPEAARPADRRPCRAGAARHGREARAAPARAGGVARGARPAEGHDGLGAAARLWPGGAHAVDRRHQGRCPQVAAQACRAR